MTKQIGFEKYKYSIYLNLKKGKTETFLKKRLCNYFLQSKVIQKQFILSENHWTHICLSLSLLSKTYFTNTFFRNENKKNP